jgi:hypothetical protein
MISCYLQGGLGNQMFQISATYSLSIDNEDVCCFDFDSCNTQLQGNTANKYKDNILKKVCNSKIKQKIHYQEPNFNFEKIPYKPDMFLLGYFQSEKYFKNNENKIQELFDCDENIKIKLFNKYPVLKTEKTCSIHIRRGDYLKFKDHHNILNMDYYNDALSHFGNDFHYLIFSDDIFWCRENFNFLENKTFCENNEDYEDLYIMSFCKNNIIANSSFSWWGAWLNKKQKNKVVAPKNWFGPLNSHLDTKDLYLYNWIII